MELPLEYRIERDALRVVVPGGGRGGSWGNNDARARAV